MNESMQNSADPWRRHKLVAIPILAFVLAIMMVRNFAGTGTSPPITPPPRPPRIPAPTATVIAPNQGANHVAAQWPKLDLDDIIAKNPFGPWNASDRSRSASANQAEPAQTASLRSADPRETSSANEQSETTPTEKVQAVYHDDAGTAAIVDSHIIRSGDALDGGVKVIDVTFDGITIRKP